MPKFFKATSQTVPIPEKTPHYLGRQWHGHFYCVCPGCQCRLDQRNPSHWDYAYCEACTTCRRDSTGSRMHKEHEICPSSLTATVGDLSE